MEKLNFAELVQIIKQADYAFIGVRHLADDEEYKVGDIARNSYDWDLDNDISTYFQEDKVELNGSCAYNTGIDAFYDDDDEIIKKLEKAIKESNVYFGKIAIIASDRMEYGFDMDEIVLENAKVLYVEQ